VKATAQPTRCSLLFRFANIAVQALYSDKYSFYAMCFAITALPQSTALLGLKEHIPAWITTKTSWGIVWLCAFWKQYLAISPVRIYQVTLKSTKDLCIYLAK